MCDYCTWINHILGKTDVDIIKPERLIPHRVDPVIIVHGGAGNIPGYARKFMLDEVKKAAIIAYCELMKNCSAVDAVELAIRRMESKKYFNCAYGGSLDVNGEVVMDAAIMTDDFRAGCVGAVRNIAHPITLAKKILQQTEHVLIVETGAQKFALESNIPILSSEKLIVTSDSKTSLHEEENNDMKKIQEPIKNESWLCDTGVCIPGCVTRTHEKEESAIPETTFIESNKLNESLDLETESNFIQVGAVGAVAYDRKRRLASGTSTAGNSGKLYGRISATGTAIGCGIYVDKNGCISVSGHDEAIHKYAPAWQISRRLQQKCMSIDKVIALILKHMEEETETSDVGAIVLTAEAAPFVSFRCTHFPWAYCKKNCLYYGCAKNEKFTEKINILERPLDCVCNDSNN